MHILKRARHDLALIAATALAVAVPASSQERATIPGTSVTLTVPAGFNVSRAGKGLENAAGSSITIGERSASAHAELAELFASAKNLSAGYAAQGVTIRSVRPIAIGDDRVPFAAGTQTSRGKTSTKYLALLKGDKTVLVTFNIADRSFSESDAEALLRSIELTPEPTVEELLSRLPFTFRVVEPFEVTDVRSRTTVTLGVGGSGDTRREQPVVVIGRGESRAVMGDEARVAVELLRSTSGFQEAVVTAQEPAPFAGGDGYRVVAVVGDRSVVQYLRIVPGGAYLRLLARGPTTVMEGAEAAIAEIATSVAVNN